MTTNCDIIVLTAFPQFYLPLVVPGGAKLERYLSVFSLNYLYHNSQVYHSLTQSRNLNVRQTLAASLHEIAKMLADCSDVEDELVPVFEDMIQVIIMFARLLYSSLLQGRRGSSDGYSETLVCISWIALATSTVVLSSLLARDTAYYKSI